MADVSFNLEGNRRQRRQGAVGSFGR